MMIKRAKVTGFEERGQPAYEAIFGPRKTMLRDRVKLGEGGRLVIPAAMREALGIKPGDDIALECVDGELKVKSYMAVIRELQAEYSRIVPAGEGTVDEFLRDRREEQRGADERLDRLHDEGMRLKGKT